MSTIKTISTGDLWELERKYEHAQTLEGTILLAGVRAEMTERKREQTAEAEANEIARLEELASRLEAQLDDATGEIEELEGELAVLKKSPVLPTGVQ